MVVFFLVLDYFCRVYTWLLRVYLGVICEFVCDLWIYEFGVYSLEKRAFLMSDAKHFIQ